MKIYNLSTHSSFHKIQLVWLQCYIYIHQGGAIKHLPAYTLIFPYLGKVEWKQLKRKWCPWAHQNMCLYSFLVFILYLQIWSSESSYSLEILLRQAGSVTYIVQRFLKWVERCEPFYSDQAGIRWWVIQVGKLGDLGSTWVIVTITLINNNILLKHSEVVFQLLAHLWLVWGKTKTVAFLGLI